MAARESRSEDADAARLYDDDFYEWCMNMAAFLRTGRLEEVDLEHVVEEIESLGQSESRELESRTIVIMLHLLKSRYQEDRRSKLWERSIVTQRIDISRLLRYSPSLKRFLPDLPERIYDGAVQFAMIETGLFRDSFPRRCPFTARDVFGEELLAGSMEQ